MSHQLQRFPWHIAAAVAVAALAAPSAVAADDLRSPDTRDAAAAAIAAAAQGGDLRSPDTKDLAAAIRARSSNPRAGDLRSPDTRDRAAGRLDPGSTGAVVITVDRPGGFDWYEAGVGAAAGAGVVLLLVGAWLLARVVRTELRPT